MLWNKFTHRFQFQDINDLKTHINSELIKNMPDFEDKK